jgi:hypothetical protein
MKKLFLLSMLTSVAMICACQKKDSVAEQQLAQPKTELGASEEALVERLNSLEKKVNSLDQRVKDLAEKGNAAANFRTSPSDVQGQTSDPAQEKQKLIQQFSAMMSNPSQLAAGDPAKQQRPGQRQLGPEDLQRQWQHNLDKAKMSGKAVFPAAEAASPSPSPVEEDTSSSPSATPQ